MGAPYEYQNSKKITVNTGASAIAIGHTVSFTINTAALISGGYVRADEKDWRVVWWNGSAWVELDRHVQFGTWNTATTRTWFKVQAAIGASSSDDNYYVYFNHPAEAGNPPANLVNVYNPPDDANTEVLWYGKDGTGGTLMDWSGNGRNRALPAGWGWTSSSKFGTGFTTPNEISSKRIGSGFTPNIATQDWTVEMWLNITDNNFGADTNDATFWHTFRWGGFVQGIFFPSPTQMYGEINNAACRCDTTTTVNQGTTYHLAMTYEASTDLLRVYRNGSLVATSPARVASGPGQLQYGADGSGDRTLGVTQEGLRVSNVRRLSFPYVVANEPTTSVAVQTSDVDLVSFVASARDGAVELAWETASELENLGFHLYRSDSSDGPYQRITATPIPGGGSTPAGARYRYMDTDLANGRTYYYKLEDIETTGRTKLHGPVSATPRADLEPNESPPAPGVAHGQPSASFRVVRQDESEMVVELRSEGYVAYAQSDGSLRFDIPGFVSEPVPGTPDMPAFRSWLGVPSDRRVSVAWAREEEVSRLDSEPPRTAGETEIVASRDGAVRLMERPGRRRSSSWAGINPARPARILEQGYQGETKKVLLELSPLRWDARRGQLLFARKLTVRLVFSRRRTPDRHTEQQAHSPRQVALRLGTAHRGLYGVAFEDLGRSRSAISAESLRLSRLGRPIAFHLEPHRSTFGPGSTLYFWSEGSSLNPYGVEAVYELERGTPLLMPEEDAAPSGSPVPYYWHRLEREVNQLYQSGLLEAPDLWLWDLLFAPVRKSYAFDVSGLAATSEASSLEVFLQGVSDLPQEPDHHVRVYVNGQLLAEKSWDGKKSQRFVVEVPPGILREGSNALELENAGDTGAAYSMVMLDKYALRYPRVPRGTLEGAFGRSGSVEVGGVVGTARVLDLTNGRPRWLTGLQASPSAIRFRVEEGRSYVVTSEGAVLRPRIDQTMEYGLKSTRNRADYLIIAPRAFRDAAQPLIELRSREGLTSRAVAVEEIYSEFGFGEPRPDAIRDFLAYAYHHWQGPKPRYVLLLGDATYDFRDYLGTGVRNQVPPQLVKTSYLWTASDPVYAAVNGGDSLPDVAIGRLPAASVDEARSMVRKILSYEAGSPNTSPVVLVADNPDQAGDFPANAEELASTVLAPRNPERIYLDRLGVERTREAITQAFDRGASLVSYVGHGGIQLWADESIFTTSRVEGLASQTRQPVLLTFNCLNGYFPFPYFNSLAEELLKAEGKGVIAAFSPSGLSLNEPAHLFHRALLEELLSGNHRTLGDAVMAAQEDYAETGAFPELLQIYHLFGDPALRLR